MTCSLRPRITCVEQHIVPIQICILLYTQSWNQRRHWIVRNWSGAQTKYERWKRRNCLWNAVEAVQTEEVFPNSNLILSINIKVFSKIWFFFWAVSIKYRYYPVLTVGRFACSEICREPLQSQYPLLKRRTEASHSRHFSSDMITFSDSVLLSNSVSFQWLQTYEAHFVLAERSNHISILCHLI